MRGEGDTETRVTSDASVSATSGGSSCPECGSDNGHGCGAAWHDQFRSPILRGMDVKGCGCRAVCDCEHCDDICTVVEYEAALSDPWTVVMEALTLQAKGEPIPDKLAELTEAASTALAASALVRAGGDIDSVCRQFEDRDHTIHLSYDFDRDELGIEIKWDDGESDTYAVSADSQTVTFDRPDPLTERPLGADSPDVG